MRHTKYAYNFVLLRAQLVRIKRIETLDATFGTSNPYNNLTQRNELYFILFKKYLTEVQILDVTKNIETT